MVRLRLGRKALCLCILALALGITPLSGGVAQAELGAKWRLNGADITSLTSQLVIKEIENKSASLSFVTKGGTAVLILCTAAGFGEGGKLIFDGTVTLGDLLFKGCITLLNEKVSANCTPHTPGKSSGEILSQKIRGLITLDTLITGEVTDLVRFMAEGSKGELSKLLAVLELGEFCAIGESVNIETTSIFEGFWIKDVGGNAGFLTEAVTHLVQEGLNTLLALGQPAKMIGSAVLELGGFHSGMKWSGRPA